MGVNGRRYWWRFACWDLGIAHLIVLYAMWQDVRRGGGPSILRSVVISLGVVSAIMLFADIAALSDIGKQTLAGLNSRGEWLIVFSDNGLRAVFLLLAAVALVRANRIVRSGSQEDDPRDVEFITVHEVGFVSALLAVAAVASWRLYSRRWNPIGSIWSGCSPRFPSLPGR